MWSQRANSSPPAGTSTRSSSISNPTGPLGTSNLTKHLYAKLNLTFYDISFDLLRWMPQKFNWWPSCFKADFTQKWKNTSINYVSSCHHHLFTLISFQACVFLRRKSCGFEKTWGWLNDDDMMEVFFIFEWNLLLIYLNFCVNYPFKSVSQPGQPCICTKRNFSQYVGQIWLNGPNAHFSDRLMEQKGRLALLSLKASGDSFSHQYQGLWRTRTCTFTFSLSLFWPAETHKKRENYE